LRSMTSSSKFQSAFQEKQQQKGLISEDVSNIQDPLDEADEKEYKEVLIIDEDGRDE